LSFSLHCAAWQHTPKPKLDLKEKNVLHFSPAPETPALPYQGLQMVVSLWSAGVIPGGAVSDYCSLPMPSESFASQHSIPQSSPSPAIGITAANRII